MEPVKQLGTSILDFSVGIARRFWAFVPGALLGAVSLVERYSDEGISVSPLLFWGVLAAGLFSAALLTYHDLRMRISQRAPIPLTLPPPASGTKSVSRVKLVDSNTMEIEQESTTAIDSSETDTDADAAA